MLKKTDIDTPKKAKPKSRPVRWADACVKAREALQELYDLQQEYEDWRNNLPDNLQDGALADKLAAMEDFDIEGAMDTVCEAEEAELPQGFGRD